jgi:hypothetical protein
VDVYLQKFTPRRDVMVNYAHWQLYLLPLCSITYSNLKAGKVITSMLATKLTHYVWKSIKMNRNEMV